MSLSFSSARRINLICGMVWYTLHGYNNSRRSRCVLSFCSPALFCTNTTQERGSLLYNILYKYDNAEPPQWPCHGARAREGKCALRVCKTRIDWLSSRVSTDITQRLEDIMLGRRQSSLRSIPRRPQNNTKSHELSKTGTFYTRCSCQQVGIFVGPSPVLQLT